MQTADTLNIADVDPEDTAQTHEPQQDSAHTRQSQYDRGDDFDLGGYGYPVPGFVRELSTELGKDVEVEDARLIDTIEPSKDIDDGMLLTFPDDSLLFIGKDPTTTDETMPWYAFTIEPFEPIPAPETAQDALDLLKPPEVRDVIAEDDWIPDRHGEWWLLPTQMVPLSKIFKPGVASEPYGPSPLGNHVPREYAFTEPADVFVAQFNEHVDSAPKTIETPPEVIEWSFRQQNKHPDVRPDDTPDWADIREWGGNVLVKGTIRHRENDHYIEDCGDVWHKASTHRMEVYTADALGEGVHLDYYGT